MKIGKKLTMTPEYIKKNRWDIIKELNKHQKRGSVLDVFELEGCYALENAAELFESIALNDCLTVCISADSPGREMLTACAADGKTVGFIPDGISLLPRFMLSENHKINCYVEYKDFTNNLLTVCVSMVAENY